MEKTLPSNWHIVCSEEHEGHKCRSILINKEVGIKAIYCQTDNKIVKMLFKKSRGWTDEQALEYTKVFLKKLKSLSCISVDQEPEFLKVIAEKTDGETLDLKPNSPSFIFTYAEEAEKGGAGSGNFGHSGREGERGGSAPSDVAQTAFSETMRSGGASVNFKGRAPKDGYMVSPYKEREDISKFVKDKSTEVKVFKNYQEKNKEFIQQKNHYLGAWVDKSKLFLDISVNVKDKAEAMSLAKENKQLAIWDVVHKQEVTIGKAGKQQVYLIPLDATDAEIESVVDALIAEQEALEKGGIGSGNFGHLGVDGQRGGSMATINVETDLSYQERKDFDALKPSQQKDYIQHRNAGMEHDVALALAEPDLVEAGIGKGGAGSGNFGHAGRVGEVGGSASDSGNAVADWKPVKDRGYLGADRPPFEGKPINPDGKTTEEMYKDKNGKYTPERAELHTAIIEKAFEGKTPVDKPTAYLMGGGPASGKSEILKSGDLQIPSNTVEVNADKVKADLPEYQKMLADKDPHSAGFTHEESSEVSKGILDGAVKGGYNTVLDGTGDSDLDKLQNKVALMKSTGHIVEANYCTVDVKTALERNLMRAEKTGRYVPEAVIRATYKSLSDIVPKAVALGLYDKFNMWDNNDKPPVRIASAEGKNLVIHDKAKWDRFLAGKDA